MTRRIYEKKSAKERFWAKIDKKGPNGCWIRLAAKTDDGYGLFWGEDQKMQSAHSFAYSLLMGSVPKNLQLDHICRNTSCVNPAHLRAVTHAKNCRIGLNAKLSEKDIPKIFGLCSRGYRQKKVAKMIGVSNSTINNILNDSNTFFSSC